MISIVHQKIFMYNHVFTLIFEHGYLGCYMSFCSDIVRVIKVFLEGGMSQIVNLGLSFYLMSKSNFWSSYKLVLLDKFKTKT